MVDVLVVGELNVDIILDKIDGFPEVGKEILAENMTVTLGSSSAIFASNLSSMGAKVAFLGKIGTDNFGLLVVDSLERKKVATRYIIHSKEYATGSTIVLNYGMDRAMVTYPGAMDHLSHLEVTDEVLLDAKHLHVSSIFLQPELRNGIVTLFQRAKKLGLTTSLDPQWDPAEKWDLDLKELLPYVDVFLPNRKELSCLTGLDDTEMSIDSLKDNANAIIVKQGEDGGAAFSKGEKVQQAAFLNNDVADCIGAGDSFDAGFISQFIKGKSMSECLQFANLMGAINTTQPGGTTSFESWGKVEEVAKNKFNQAV